MRKYGLILVSILIGLSSCVTVGTRTGRHAERAVKHSGVFNRAFTGFVLMDPESGKLLADYQGSKYFTPASNTKILALAACLEYLPDTLPAIKVINTDNRIYFRGTANPVLLHPEFSAWQSWKDSLGALAGQSKSIVYYPRSFPEPRFGPGWSWDDYNEYYMTERTEMPVYGNCVSISSDGVSDVQIRPAYFSSKYGFREKRDGKGITRLENENFWLLEPGVQETDTRVPFTGRLTQQLLGAALGRSIGYIDNTELPLERTYPAATLPSAPLDTVLRRMMYQSDNFVAEQLLYMCADARFGVLEQDTIIEWMLDSVLQLPVRPRWVDGSGLSRYNLNTPASLATTLKYMWNKYPHDRLLSLFPAGGQHGTIEEWYAPEQGSAPFVYAKTGGLRGVHCLSGYVRTRGGKMLIFSFMHNNFAGSNREWKSEMDRILRRISR